MSIRPIMDLRDLNLYIPHKKFHMLTLCSILPLLSQGNWFITIDLQEALTKSPFEPMATCSEKLPSMKTAFLVDITSARRASDLAALRSDLSFLKCGIENWTQYSRQDLVSAE